MSKAPSILGILGGLLLISALCFALGKSEDRDMPSVENLNPRGLAAFRELLERAGYEVELNTREAPKVSPTDLVIAAENTDERAEKFDKSIEEYLRSGGRLLELRVPSYSGNSPSQSSHTQLENLRGERVDAEVNDSVRFDSWFAQTSDHAPESVVWRYRAGPKLGQQPVQLTIGHFGRVMVANLGDAATNSHLSLHQNAELLLRCVNGIAEGRKRIVFVEYQIGNGVHPSLWQDIGAYAGVAYWQFMLLVATVVYTGTRRFGPPVEVTHQVRGAKEMVDAFGDLMHRGERVDLALKLIYGHIDLRIRRALNLARNADLIERNQHLDPKLLMNMQELERGSVSHPSRSVAVRLVRETLMAVEGLEKTRR